METDSLIIKADRYIETLINAARTLPELIDKDRYSPTYGSFYYMFWRCKSIDYDNARCQEAAYTLALLYYGNYPGNQFQGVVQIKELALAAMLRWADSQHADGSFDEWYANEHGFAATAFSSFAISRAYRLLQEEMGEKERKRILTAFSKAAAWLCRHDDLSKLNHEAVAAAALYSLAEVLRDKSLVPEAEKKVSKVLQRQTPEGWFPELGGMDTGYSFLTLEYLALSYTFSRDERLKASLERALEFLSFFVHPDISTGREYNVCGNSYVSLLGSAILSEFSPLARKLFLEGISRNNILIQLAQDDLSLCYHLYIGILAYEYFRSNLKHFQKEVVPLPYQHSPFQKYFPSANMLVVKTRNYYALAGCNNGGLLKVFPCPQEDRDSDLGCHDLGYTVSPKPGRRLHSSRLAPNSNVTVQPEGGLEVICPFRRSSYFFPSPFSRFLLKLFSALPGGYLFIKKGVDFVRKRKKASLQLASVSGRASLWTLKRKIYFHDQWVETNDEIIAPEKISRTSIDLDLEIRKGSYVISYPRPVRDVSETVFSGDRPYILKKIIKPMSDKIEVEFNPRNHHVARSDKK